MARTGQLIIVSAPSGAGKTSLVKELLETLSDIEVSVSSTTRAPRSGEVNGIDYHFISEEGFQQVVAQDGFLEYATVFGNSYGTSKRLVDEKLAQGVDIILEIDWQGAQQVRRVMKDSCSIFILPPSKQVLEDRLRGRGLDSDEVINKRMRTAVDEMVHHEEYDFLVVNDDFEVALDELAMIVKTQRLAMKKGKLTHSTLIHQLHN